MKNYNNNAGTTSSNFAISVGSASSAVQHILGATCNATDVAAKDKNNGEIALSGIVFYDMKIVAKNAAGKIAAKQLRGTVAGTTVKRIEEIFQEDFSADVVLSSSGTTLTVTCKHTGSLTHYTIYATMTSVDI
jgi:hypothetical protein